jgi:simple sugar transport system ATP-binding protein
MQCTFAPDAGHGSLLNPETERMTHPNKRDIEATPAESEPSAANGLAPGESGPNSRVPSEKPESSAAMSVGTWSSASLPFQDEPVLRAVGITKRYGAVSALRGADFEVYAGEVTGLVGDNGAGKSTLLKTLSGSTHPDEGSIFLDGRRVVLQGPHDAMAQGIETVYQDLALAPALDAAGNLFLGREIPRPGLLGRMGFLHNAEMQRQASESMRNLGIDLQDPHRPIRDLSGGQRQCVAIARSAAWARKVIFLDEPTAALGVVQTRNVLDLIRRIRDSGLAVVLVSHSLADVLELCDRVSVFRLGKRVANFKAASVTAEELIAAMTGVQGPNETSRGG